MQPKHPFAYLVAVVVCLAATHAYAANRVYEVQPYSLSRGYEILGGTITTDGSVGTNFVESSIVDYQILIGGSINFTFSPANRLPDINFDALVQATETELFIIAAPPGGYGELRFSARELLGGVNQQQVNWGQGGSPTARSLVGFIDASGPLNQGTLEEIPMLPKLVVATAAPPLPEVGEFMFDPDSETFGLSFNTETGVTYSLTACTNLNFCLTNVWNDLTNVAGTGGEVFITNVVPTGKFEVYRVFEIP